MPDLPKIHRVIADAIFYMGNITMAEAMTVADKAVQRLCELGLIPGGDNEPSR